MDCLFRADCGMSTDSHLHEQAPSRESMSQPLSHTQLHNAATLFLILSGPGFIVQWSYIPVYKTYASIDTHTLPYTQHAA